MSRTLVVFLVSGYSNLSSNKNMHIVTRLRNIFYDSFGGIESNVECAACYAIIVLSAAETAKFREVPCNSDEGVAAVIKGLSRDETSQKCRWVFVIRDLTNRKDMC